jgi:hypothetical protein
MNLRIQTYGEGLLVLLDVRTVSSLIQLIPDDVNVQDVLEKGLNDLMDLCDVVIDKFTIAREEFHLNKATG